MMEQGRRKKVQRRDGRISDEWDLKRWKQKEEERQMEDVQGMIRNYSIIIEYIDNQI